MKDGMERDLIIYVMEKAVMAGAYRFDYIDSTLRNLYTKGVRTKEQSLVEEERFKRRGGKTVEQGQSKRGSPTRGRGEHKNYSGAGTNLEGLIISGSGNEAVEPG
jgi:DNA replication protein DnaD